MSEQEGEVVLGAYVALVGGGAEQSDCFDEVGFRALAVSDHLTQVVLRFGVALAGSAFQ